MVLTQVHTMLPGVRCPNCGDRIEPETVERCGHCGKRIHAPCHDYHVDFDCPAAPDHWVSTIEF